MVVWHASAITGGSADTMEEEDLKSGWRRLGGAFSTPLTAVLFLPRWGTQQRAVTTAHQGDAAPDQTDDMAAKIMVLPGAATDALHAVQSLGDFMIATSRQPGVEGSHHQNKAPPTPARERKRRRTKSVTFDGAPKSVCRLQTQAGTGINRQFD